MSSIVIGHSEKNKNVSIDLDVLLRTRLLVQANSGGGKSWALRRILEQAFGKVQSIVIDPAGEFATLREKYGYVLVGKGGETPADVRSAGLLAEKLLELRASAVCDLYGMKTDERPLWVKKFLSATMNVPKKLWHPVLFVVDEAHKFCPEKGEGESEAKQEMLQLVSDGRKYGFCSILATQRLSKLDKSAAAELLNVLIGPTFIDIDLERAHKALGIVKADYREFDAAMKTAEPGQFYCLGRAISKERLLVRVGGIETSHPEAGSARHAAEPPPAPEKVQALLPKLADLPQAAEEKAKTEAELRHEVRQLRAQLRDRQRSVDVLSKTVKTETKVDQAAIDKAVKLWQDRAVLEAKRHLDHGERIAKGLKTLHASLVKLSGSVLALVDDISGSLNTVKVSKNPESVHHQYPGFKPEKVHVVSTELAKHDPTLPPAPRRSGSIRVEPAQDGEGEKLTGPEQRIIDAIAWLNSVGIEYPDQVAVAFLAGYTYDAGGYNNPRGALNRKGLVKYLTGNRIALTETGRAAARVFDEDLTQEELHRRVMDRLPGPEQRILKPLLEAFPNPLTNEELAEKSNYAVDKGGFNNPRGRLRTLGLIEYPEPGKNKASDVLFFE